MGRLNRGTILNITRFRLAVASLLWIFVSNDSQFDKIPAERIEAVRTSFAQLGDETPALLRGGYHLFELAVRVFHDETDVETAGKEMDSILAEMKAIPAVEKPIMGEELSAVNQLCNCVLVWLAVLLPPNKRNAKKDKRATTVMNGIRELLKVIKGKKVDKGEYAKKMRELKWENGVSFRGNDEV